MAFETKGLSKVDVFNNALNRAGSANMRHIIRHLKTQERGYTQKQRLCDYLAVFEDKKWFKSVKKEDILTDLQKFANLGVELPTIRRIPCVKPTNTKSTFVRGDVMTDPQPQYPIPNLTVACDIPIPGVPSAAECMFKKLMAHIADFEKGLNKDQEVGASMVSFGDRPFYIGGIGYQGFVHGFVSYFRALGGS